MSVHLVFFTIIAYVAVGICAFGAIDSVDISERRLKHAGSRDVGRCEVTFFGQQKGSIVRVMREGSNRQESKLTGLIEITQYSRIEACHERQLSQVSRRVSQDVDTQKYLEKPAKCNSGPEMLENFQILIWKRGCL